MKQAFIVVCTLLLSASCNAQSNEAPSNARASLEDQIAENLSNKFARKAYCVETDELWSLQTKLTARVYLVRAICMRHFRENEEAYENLAMSIQMTLDAPDETLAPLYYEFFRTLPKREILCLVATHAVRNGGVDELEKKQADLINGTHEACLLGPPKQKYDDILARFK